MTTVLLVDDHPVVRSGLSALIASTDDLTVVGAATGGEQAITMATACEPDVVLMDLSMPGMDGIVATRRLLEVRPDTRVVVLTSFLDQDRVTEALAAGAVGYLLKDCDPRELLSAIRAASLGHAPLDPRVARVLLPASGERLGDVTDVDPSRPDQGRPDQGRPDQGRPDQGRAGARRDAAPGLDSSGPGPSPDNPAWAGPQHPNTQRASSLSARELQVLRLVAKGLPNKQIGRLLGISERTVKVHVGHLFRRIGVADRTSAALWATVNLPAEEAH